MNDSETHLEAIKIENPQEQLIPEDQMNFTEKEVRIVPLFSGSSGNSVYFQFGSLRFLVDAGCSCKRIITALGEINCKPNELNAVFITHNHADHINGLDVLMRKYHVPVYATTATWDGIRPNLKPDHNIQELCNIILPNEIFQFYGMDVFPFSTPHDAAGSVGYRFSKNSLTMSIATDLGWYSETVRYGVKGSDLVYIEANYNDDMLWKGDYPWYLKKRIGSKTGHLCNRDCADAISELIADGTKYFILGHLSQENNTPEIAQSDVEKILAQRGLINGDQYELFIAARNHLSDSFNWSGGVSFSRIRTGSNKDRVEQAEIHKRKDSVNPEIISRQLDIFHLLHQMESDSGQFFPEDSLAGGIE